MKRFQETRSVLVALVFLMSLLADLLVAEDLPSGDGSIEGWVVNASSDSRPLPDTKVVLRVRLQGQFVPVEEVTTDADGRFVFEQLPIGDDVLYLPGANVDGVHYPGARVTLSSEQPRARVKLEVFDSVAGPSPLVADRLDILVEPDTGVLKITETIVVNNPSSKCYVGGDAQGGGAPKTLRLAIPKDFQRATFHEEFFGRQFKVRDGKVVTSIPWPPGKREIKFTYLIPNEDHHRVVERELDLSCAKTYVTVCTDQPEQFRCNLAAAKMSVEARRLAFESNATLPAGHVIRIEMGQLPVSPLKHARWGAAVALLVLAAGTVYRAKRLER